MRCVTDSVIEPAGSVALGFDPGVGHSDAGDPGRHSRWLEQVLTY